MVFGVACVQLAGPAEYWKGYCRPVLHPAQPCGCLYMSLLAEYCKSVLQQRMPEL